MPTKRPEEGNEKAEQEAGAFQRSCRERACHSISFLVSDQRVSETKYRRIFLGRTNKNIIE